MFPYLSIKDCSLSTLEGVLLVVPRGPDVSAAEELWAVWRVGEVPHTSAGVLGADQAGEAGQGGAEEEEVTGGCHGQVWLHEMPKSDWRQWLGLTE